MRAGRDLAVRFRAFGRDRRGSVAIMAGAYGVCLIAALALAVDLGSVYYQRRKEQGAIDLAALAAARDLTHAEKSARASLVANGVAAPKSLKVTLGSYVPDRTSPAGRRFQANTLPINAVQLAMTNDAQLFFGKGIVKAETVAVNVAATAVNTRLVAFSIGSRLASLQGGLANAVLSSLLGGSVNLSVMDYDSLASAKVDMPTLLTALGSQIGVTAGTYDQVLSVSPGVGQLANALAIASGAGSTVRSALARIGQAGGGRAVDMRQVVSLGALTNLAIGAPTGVAVQASVLDVLNAALGVANGQRQVDLNLGAQAPGLLGLTASLTVGERMQSSPWLTVGVEGATVRTAQLRLRLIAQVAGTGGLPGLRLPIALDIASAEADLAAATCGANPRTSASVTLAVTPAAAELWVGEPSSPTAWSDFTRAPSVVPATVVDALLLQATASAHVAATNLRPQSVTYNWTDIQNAVTKTVSTVNTAETTLTSLTKNLSVQVKVLGLITLGTPQAATALLAQTLSPVGALVDPVLNQVLSLLGVGIGQADVTVRGLRCDGAALVG